MALKQINNIGGLDLRSSDINRPEHMASDLQNVHLNSRREIVKRYGYDKLVDDSDIMDLYHFQGKSKLIGMKAGGIYTYNFTTDVFDSAKMAMFTPPTYTGRFSFAEYNNTLYIADQEGEHDIMKFDGSRFYRAGAPIPVAVHTGAGGTTDVRIVNFFRDLNGNVTISDYLEFNNVADSTTFTVDTFKNTDFNFTFGTANGTQTIQTGTYTLNTNTHNFVAGDKILRYISGAVGFPTDGGWVILDIESVVANTSITFTTASVDASGVSILILDGTGIDDSQWGIIFSKPSANFEYFQAGSFVYENTGATNGITSLAYSNLRQPMDDIADTAVVRQLPPRAKYLSMFNSMLIAGNVTLEEGNPFYSTTASELASSIYWSDSVGRPGSSVESFLPFNEEDLGKSDEGEVSGIFSNSDYVEIHLQKQIYYLSGDLINYNYRVKSALSAGVGAVSHRSIAEIVGHSIFMTSKGLYGGAYGKPPLELSDKIEPLFTEDTTGLDLSLAVSVVDIQNEKILTYIPATLVADSLVTVFDLYYKEWFVYKGIDASNGFTLVNGVRYHHDGTSLYGRSSTYNDNGSAIDAYYATAWHNLQLPSIDKKFINAIVASLTTGERTVSIKSQSDWEDVDETDESLSFTKAEVLDHEIDITQANSMRLIFGNNVKNEPLLITAYEFEYEFTQTKPKGEY